MSSASRLGATLFVLLMASATQVAPVQTRTWTGTPADLERGETEGVAVTSKGRLFLAPRLSPVGSSPLKDPPAHVWATATDRSGSLYLGTGPEGRILKLSASGQQSVLFTVPEPMVTALAVTPEGDLLAGTAPEGKIYRIRPDGRGQVWCETGERYVWSLAVGREGVVYAGTGEQGILFKVDRTGKASPLFDSDESHIMAIAVVPDGSLLAGGAGRGLLYRVDAEGHALVAHDDDLPEVRALMAEADGSILAALVAPPEPEPRPPAVRIQVSGAEAQGPSSDLSAEVEGRQGLPIQGIIEGLPSQREEVGRRLRGRVIRLGRDGTVTELWRSHFEAPYSLALDGSGRPYFGAGEPARLYRIEGEGEVALLDTLREAQVTGLALTRGALVAATSNPAGAYRLEEDPPGAGLYESRAYDAGVVARWGSIRWRVEGKGGRAELYTRTGNSADPDGSWSAWSPALVDPEGTPIPNPEGRFLQWRAKLSGSGAGPMRVTAVSVSFQPHNRPPTLRDFRLDGGSGSVSGNVSVRWTASDPDGDPLLAEVRYRRDGTTEWQAGARLDLPPKASESGDDPDPSWRDGKAAWDTKVVDEGVYEVRLWVTDQPSNAAGAGKEATFELPLPVIVDRSPPVLEVRRGKGGTVEVTASDVLSSIARLEIVSEGRTLFAARPLDEVCDSRRETFTISPADAGEPGSRTLRAVDAAGNTAETPVP